jgi:hypothetical protein
MFGIIAIALLSFAGWRWGRDSRNHAEAAPRDGVAPRDW